MSRYKTFIFHFRETSEDPHSPALVESIDTHLTFCISSTYLHSSKYLQCTTYSPISPANQALFFLAPKEISYRKCRAVSSLLQTMQRYTYFLTGWQSMLFIWSLTDRNRITYSEPVWEIGPTWELRTATPVPRPIQYTEMDLRNKTTSELRTQSPRCP